ncbi:TetR/AcrR family transcriptional regulator [Tsukamurella tyrosinosolvens]|uniref:TetR/AcrR family transcriptional regulator n=1 Tax=Tsukamurella tyrosinosolvens TaxID=57704 RepID=UPI00079BCF0F|nr:TetR/AcrR family transcriptional regulator [Tsukamurella tyrosinosolvens]AUN39755.1 TetR family transcriptional regulator [Tsukamurella tyrosinosolvens]KXP08988.1 TetR family transcriptional regulator [Tsukamurella tyrosinosolvens]KZL97216.1 TetR family transcriptional regulator [Tsukamurella tyrosinosolvens]MCA4996884.1 TetR/AcrR family transcriptional regulator [Tsukamurella tyrosinosolvens]QRY86520.1 TetR/AcrR family transcriptional regulator [Tsukamurella tyrosinosolvens]
MATAHEPESGYELRWRAHNSQRRELILRAAAELVEESEPGAPIPVRSIAERAGLVKSVVYRQFKSKDDLARGLRGFVVDQFAAELEADLDVSTGSLREILRRSIASAATWMQDNPRLVDLLRAGPTDAAGPDGVPVAPDAIGELRHRVVARAEQTIDGLASLTGLDPAAFAGVPFVVFTMVEGTLTSWVRGEAAVRGRTRAEVVESLTDVTWFVLDGAARTLGVHVDPDAELTRFLESLAPDGVASGRAVRRG